ncbi:MAG: Holliday junction branch migration protein RuvA [Clostridia bacterium]|nr:Holliday junction branch migration protein RuvA [Clostridia bacterium]
MFYYIKGPLAFSDLTCAVIEAGGVGYKMTVSQTTHDALPALGKEAKLYTYLAVREDGIELFGFATMDELAAFKLLIGVSGVGPKVAISVLSLLTPQKFTAVVCSEDKKTLGKASGVGAKTAARIILELKDKMSAGVVFSDSTMNADVAVANESSSEFADAMDALSVLGFTRADILVALRGVDTSKMNAEEIIKLAMKKLVKI